MRFISQSTIMNRRDCLKDDSASYQSKIQDLNQTVWLWSCGKNLAKKEIKDYAAKIYLDAGVKSFKKTDDIHSERLIGEEQNIQNICDLNDESSKINDQSHSEVNNEDCLNYNLSNTKSEDDTQQINVSSSPQEQYSKDCTPIGRLPDVALNEKYSLRNRANQKYCPNFKAKVISYAMKNSLKNASLTFKVNKDTVSEWIRQSNPNSSLPQKNRFLDCMFQDDIGPDDKFILWLKSVDKNVMVSRESLTQKVSDLIEPVVNSKPNKKNLWFHLYAKRLQTENSDKILIQYPLAFKQELVSYTNNFSKKMISDTFNIHRKRICEWVSDFKKDNIKKRDVSKYLTDADVDNEVWEWYSQQTDKPTSKEVRIHAAHLYEKAGFSGMRCSNNWYYRWRIRHHLPPARTSQASRDSELLVWLLKQIDQNRSILHSELMNQASSYKGSDFQASPSWVFRFLKRHMSYLYPGSINLSLPDPLSEEMNNYRTLLSARITRNNLILDNVIAFDELPLNFACTASSKNDYVGKSEWDDCQGSVILACTATGRLIPTCLILKSSLEQNFVVSEKIQPILVQSEGINDKSTIEKWQISLLRNLSYPSLIICDAYDPHFYLKKLISEDKRIELMIIPAGCSSQLQPIFFGIAEHFKTCIENFYQRWCHEASTSGSITFKIPSNKDIYSWVLMAHSDIESSGSDLIREAFMKAGFPDHLKYMS